MSDTPNRSIASQAAQRVGAIVATAELQAQAILAEAEQVAAGHHASARRDIDRDVRELQEVAASLAEAATTVQAQLGALDALQQRLDALARRTASAPVPRPAPTAVVPDPLAQDHEPSVARIADPRDGGEPQATDPPAAAEPEAPQAPTPVAAPAAESGEPAAEDPIAAVADDVAGSADAARLDAARLVALSMAASGRTRDEVEAHLREHLEIGDPSTVIDYVFGISTPSSIVPGWPPNGRHSGGD